MVISFSDTLTHTPACEKANLKSKELEKTVIKNLKDSGFTARNFKVNPDGNLEIKNPDHLKLHTFMLNMESLGLDIKLTKQTVIEVG